VHRVAPLPPPPAGLGFCESVPPVLSFCGGATQTASSVWSGPRGYSLHRARNPRHVATFLACSACVARASANLPFCPESWKILCMTSRNTPVSCWWCEHNWAPRVASLLGKRHLFKRMLKGSAMQAMSHIEDPSESATVWLAFLLCGGAGCTKLRHPLGKSQQKCLCIKGAGWCQNPCPRQPRAARRF